VLHSAQKFGLMKRAKILVVDDDLAILTLMRNVLREYDLDAVVADSGTSALELARSERPDLILLDRKMPGMSGEEAVRVLRSQPSLRNVPILILSGEPMSRREIEAVGADGAVQKPFELSDLINQIQSRLQPISSTD
jgi:CheY-like chemotaxis protein